jgi:CRISPR-associated exonuclease Cas4
MNSMNTDGGDRDVVFTVTDVKQYTYCPRVVYYTYCLPLIRPTTFKMEEGITVHEEEKARERRRSLRVYGLPEGKRAFDLDLYAPTLGLTGRLDLVIRIDGTSPEAVPVEYKHSRKAGTHVKRQLAAYALLLEDAWQIPVRRAFVYLIPERKACEMPVSKALIGRVKRQIADMRKMVRTESIPDTLSRHAPCIACEFRRFCNDV